LIKCRRSLEHLCYEGMKELMKELMNISQWKAKAKNLKREIYALYFAYRSPKVSWYAKLFTLILVGYALSPIDLIPDFIPIIGYLDDLILLPLGVTVALKLIPNDVMIEAREQAQKYLEEKPKNWIAAVIIIFIWLILATWIVSLIAF